MTNHSAALVPRTRNSHHNCRESGSELRVQSGTRIITLLVSFDSEVRIRACCNIERTSESKDTSAGFGADRHELCRKLPQKRPACLTLLQASHGTLRSMRKPRRRPLHREDLPLRLSVAAEPNRRFRYVILRNDGTVAQASSATFATEAQAQAAGTPVLRRRSLAARLTPSRRVAD